MPKMKKRRVAMKNSFFITAAAAATATANQIATNIIISVAIECREKQVS